MWDPPRPGLEPASPAPAGRFSTTAPPGKPHGKFLNNQICNKENPPKIFSPCAPYKKCIRWISLLSKICWWQLSAHRRCPDSLPWHARPILLWFLGKKDSISGSSPCTSVHSLTLPSSLTVFCTTSPDLSSLHISVEALYSAVSALPLLVHTAQFRGY